MFLCRKSWKNDVFRALSTRLDKCNDIQMSRIILCLWGAWSNWILIKYWERETLYLIMQAVPLVFLSGELQSAQQNGLWELVAGSACLCCIQINSKYLHKQLPWKQALLERWFKKQGQLMCNKYKYYDVWKRHIPSQLSSRLSNNLMSNLTEDNNNLFKWSWAVTLTLFLMSILPRCFVTIPGSPCLFPLYLNPFVIHIICTCLYKLSPVKPEEK